MNVWQDTPAKNNPTELATMADVVFRIDCQSLPADHAASLSGSISTQVPWLATHPYAGVHTVHLASQNGWQRPEGNDDVIILSKRTRLKIRTVADQGNRLITALLNTSHCIDGHRLHIVDGKARPLTHTASLYSRHTYFNPQAGHNEEQFVNCVIDACRQLNFEPSKVLCGKTHQLMTATRPITTRSVLLADVPAKYSLALQDQGLGALRMMGCGLIVPYKDTGAV